MEPSEAAEVACGGFFLPHYPPTTRWPRRTPAPAKVARSSCRNGERGDKEKSAIRFKIELLSIVSFDSFHESENCNPVALSFKSGVANSASSTIYKCVVHGSAVRRATGLVKFVPAVAHHFCLACLQRSCNLEPVF